MAYCDERAKVDKVDLSTFDGADVRAESATWAMAEGSFRDPLKTKIPQGIQKCNFQGEFGSPWGCRLTMVAF